MKRLITPLLLLSFILPIKNRLVSMPPPLPEFHPECEKVNKTQPLNYLGTSLTLPLDDPKDLLLCPGDTFGDLNETYVKIQDCNLTMYHKDKMIWSKGRRDYLRSQGQCPNDDYCLCLFYLQKDGNLVLHQDGFHYSWSFSSHYQRESRIDFGGPIKTELRLKDEQVQIIRSFSDGTQRLFYLDENHNRFTEDVGEPIKIADKLVIKSHQDEDKTILRRNEYIGDLNGSHLILQIDCQLQLLNKNEIIWSLAHSYSYDIPCTLDVAQDNTIQISRRWMNQTLAGQSVMESEANLEVIESTIILGDREPIITQTLKNGSELIFYGGRFNRQFKQIAQKTLIAQRSPSDQDISRMERMEYLGNLTGLHLKLEQNCSLILANGNEKLWEFQSEPRNTAAIGCSVQLQDHGRIILYKYPHGYLHLLEHSSSDTKFIIEVELKLENDQIVVKRKRKDQEHPDIFYAGRQTNGTFFQFIAENSITIDNHNHYYSEIMPKMGYIGDLNGVYVLLDKNCNLVLYNKTQVLWESGTSLDHSCGLGLHDDWEIKISTEMPNNWRKTLWSAFDVPPHVNFEKLLKAELSIVNDELWLIYTFRDGTVNREKANQGTNRFTNNLAQSLPPFHWDVEKIMFCKERNLTKSLNYDSLNLTSNSDDPRDIVLCPGDTFGDLNETYVAVKNCYLEMYHKNKTIWTSKIDTTNMLDWMRTSEKYSCAVSLKRNGNLVLYKEGRLYLSGGSPTAVALWNAQTNMNSAKTDLRLQGQQIQIVHTLRNGTQKLFYADENHQEFIEDMGEPIKVADKFIIKSHSDENKTILRRNEYIGDLNGTHLILQTNCELQLVNKNKTIWSFIPPFRHQMNCTLDVANDNTIEISSLLTDSRESIMEHRKPLEVVKSHITFEGDQPRIIQTLKNGSELIFCGAGLNSGLNLKRDLKQIAQKTIALQFDTSDSDSDDEDSDNEDDLSVIKRMSYIGNLTGLHLILEQNCSLILANGHQKLWEIRSKPPKYGNPVLDCLVRLYSRGRIMLERESMRNVWDQGILDNTFFSGEDKSSIVGFTLTLEDDQMIIKREFHDRSPKVYSAGPKTGGALFQFIAERSVSVAVDMWKDLNEILPKNGYIGDLNGVYAILDKNCNLVLYNKTQVLWESSHSLDHAWSRCSLQVSSEGKVHIIARKPSEARKFTWSPVDSPTDFCSLKIVLGIELAINEDELWLIYTFQDGTIHEYKAIMGTNRFAIVSKKHDLFFNVEL